MKSLGPNEWENSQKPCILGLLAHHSMYWHPRAEPMARHITKTKHENEKVVIPGHQDPDQLALVWILVPW